MQFEVTADAIRDDDVDAIHRLFQERRCRPLDHIVWKTGREENLLEVSALGPPRVHLAMNCDSDEVAAVC